MLDTFLQQTKYMAGNKVLKFIKLLYNVSHLLKKFYADNNCRFVNSGNFKYGEFDIASDAGEMATIGQMVSGDAETTKLYKWKLTRFDEITRSTFIGLQMQDILETL